VLEQDFIDGEVLLFFASSICGFFWSGALAGRLFICSTGVQSHRDTRGNLRMLQGFQFAGVTIFREKKEA